MLLARLPKLANHEGWLMQALLLLNGTPELAEAVSKRTTIFPFLYILSWVSGCLPAKRASTLAATLVCTRHLSCDSTSTKQVKTGAPRLSVFVLLPVVLFLYARHHHCAMKKAASAAYKYYKYI